MTTTKKLTLLLLPLVPLTAIGIVELAGTIATPDQETIDQGTICKLPDSPHVAPEPVDPKPVDPKPAPALIPQPAPVA